MAKKTKARAAAKTRRAKPRAASKAPGTARGPRLPLTGIRVVEFTHMVMGPTCGMILGDLGAEVIKVEPPGGDKTRKLIGSGAGFFPLFNRNKKSLTADLANPKDRARIEKLIATADIVSENFRPGALKKHGFDYASLKKKHKRLIYVSHKGFLPGPYEHRVALDEVVQMMGGLAYMTGPPGRPLRAGSSVNDIMGGMFGVIGALAALTEREHTGKGQEVQVGLFENCVLLSAQHMLQYRLTGVASPPMPDRINAWGVFDLFDTSDGEQVFLGVVTDTQWAVFGRAFDLGGLADDPRLADQQSARSGARMDAAGAARDRQEILRGGFAGGVRARGAALRADRQAGAIVRRSASAGERRARRPDAGERRDDAGAAAAAVIGRPASQAAHAAAESGGARQAVQIVASRRWRAASQAARSPQACLCVRGVD